MAAASLLHVGVAEKKLRQSRSLDPGTLHGAMLPRIDPARGALELDHLQVYVEKHVAGLGLAARPPVRLDAVIQRNKRRLLLDDRDRVVHAHTRVAEGDVSLIVNVVHLVVAEHHDRPAASSHQLLGAGNSLDKLANGGCGVKCEQRRPPRQVLGADTLALRYLRVVAGRRAVASAVLVVVGDAVPASCHLRTTGRHAARAPAATRHSCVLVATGV